MVKIFSYVAGNTLDSHEEILKKLKKRGATIEPNQENCDYTIIFCPIVSRFETDIQSALSTMPGSSSVILVAMHHTYDPNYPLPGKRNLDNTAVRGLLEFLFFEKKGLLKCSCNSMAKKALYKKLGLPRWPYQLKK
ncbi:hypothetical protein AMECASPLE_023065 [Ameca splendens]|uniref:Uncharacterized protein n=1 Tax=Ameca splendens TaxID=208324 RepID=A0ABV0ZQP4_9TELE